MANQVFQKKKKKRKKKEKKRSKFELEGTHDARSRQATQPPSELEKRFGVFKPRLKICGFGRGHNE
jgi:hypothetical protein